MALRVLVELPGDSENQEEDMDQLESTAAGPSVGVDTAGRAYDSH